MSKTKNLIYKNFLINFFIDFRYQKSSLTTKYAMEEITKTSKFTMTITFTHLLFFGIYTACSLFVRVLGQQFFGSFINFYVARGINCAVPTYNLVIVIVGFVSLYQLNRKRNQAVTTNVQMMSIGSEGAKNYDEAITNQWATVVSGKVWIIGFSILYNKVWKYFVLLFPTIM